MKTITEMRTELTAKAAASKDFRKALLNDPKAVIAEEYGAKIPEGFTIKVHEDTPTDAHIILQPPSKLTPAELNRVNGMLGSEHTKGGY